MHEITLCQNAIAMLEQQARLHGAQRITGVWLETGAFSCVEPQALAFCFELVCRGTLAEGCVLHLSQQQSQVWCHDCQQAVNLLSSKVTRCPLCASSHLRIGAADDGVIIKRLEVE
ncbi:hydrogenase maturation nickel metallochaperone HypA [Yersinia enterocolitica]|nr:hydrogenase maturation nickel metallochaperone HypA [Yersinia enterocolitica]